MANFYISSNKYSLQERQTKLNGKVYDVVFRIVTMDGIEKQKKLSGYKTKALAKEAYLEFVQENCELLKNNPLKKKNTDKEIPLVGDLLKQYYSAMHNQVKESTIYDRIHILDKYILPVYANTKITELTEQELYQWQDKLWAMKNPRTNDYYSYNQLLKIRGYFRSFLSWVKTRYGYDNNLFKVKAPKRRKQRTEMKFWDRETFEKFISVVDDDMYRCLFSLLFYTGRRKGEIFALSPEDFKKGKIHIYKNITTKTLDGSPYKITTTKAEKEGWSDICPAAQKALDAYKGQSPFFFGGDKPLPPETVRKRFKRYIKKAEVEEIRIHDLRHSFVSMIIHMGATLPVVADLIDDTLEQVTETYAHMYPSDKAEILAKIQ